ncbi:hypothetical protein QYF36_019975 [Acer negundo]|nr:hypothetical protein QYF36_019975 [Acer negundo]
MPVSGSFGRIYGSLMNLNSSYLQSNVSKDVILKPKIAFSSTIDSIPLLKNFASRKRKHESNYYGQAATSRKEKQGFVRGLVKYVVMDNQKVMPKLSSSSTTDSIPLLKNFVSRKRKHESSYYGQYGTYGAAKARRVDPSSSGSSYTSSSDSSSKSRAATSRKEKQGFVRGLVKYIVMDNLKVMPISSFSIISLLNQYRVNDFSSLRRKLSPLTSIRVWSLLRLHLHRTQFSPMYLSESPGTSRRNCDSESILLDFMREAISD